MNVAPVFYSVWKICSVDRSINNVVHVGSTLGVRDVKKGFIRVCKIVAFLAKERDCDCISIDQNFRR